MNIIYHSSYLVDYNVVMQKSDRLLNFVPILLKIPNTTFNCSSWHFQPYGLACLLDSQKTDVLTL